MSRVLTQAEIDELFSKYSSQWQFSYDFRQNNNADCKPEALTQAEIDRLLGQCVGAQGNTSVNARSRFRNDEVYVVDDYELFYCKYPLEELTSSLAVLRRYAYGDTETFKLFGRFMVIEDYKNKGINAASVVGVSTDTYELGHSYSHDRSHGTVYLVDASSLSYSFSLCDISKQTIKSLREFEQNKK